MQEMTRDENGEHIGSIIDTCEYVSLSPWSWLTLYTIHMLSQPILFLGI